jgi:hypothetical protein
MVDAAVNERSFPSGRALQPEISDAAGLRGADVNRLIQVMRANRLIELQNGDET